MMFEGLHAWITAWEAAMAEAGHPRARLDTAFDDEMITYTWVHDVDGWFGSDQEAWDDAHRAFVLVDRIRPPFVRPSFVLAEMLAGRWDR